MPAENQDHARTVHNANETTEMAKYDITRTPIDYFYCGKYRYTDLKDAIAQARRQTAAR